MSNPWPGNGLDKADRPDRGANRERHPEGPPLAGWLTEETYRVGRNAAKRASGTRRRVADRPR